MKTDILIAGCGCAGLYCALNLPKDKKITIITKSDIQSSDSYLAQGGICTLKDETDYEDFFSDTLKAGHNENDRKSVEIMIKSSPDVIADLVSYGTEFEKDADGRFVYTKEGAHSKGRILFHADATGKEITSKLLKEAQKRENIKILEHTTMADIIEKDSKCVGAVVYDKNDTPYAIFADCTILATGGVGGLFSHSTNYPHLTGDALAIAGRHGVEFKDTTYVQIHPTTFYSDDERSFLISESVRGEGAVLRDKNGERFTNELLPRDVLTQKIYEQMEKDKTSFVWEDMTPIGKDKIESHFPNIAAYCREKGYDVSKEWIPVVPAQHYFMGGIKIDHSGKTSMQNLYAIGETACNGVHGKNRLASNSLLESLVFAKRAAADISSTKNTMSVSEENISLAKYNDRKKYETENIEIAKKIIEGEFTNV